MGHARSNLGRAWYTWRARAGDRRRRERDRPHRLAFEAFYDTIPLYKPPVFVFFSRDLLHWAMKTIAFVPRDVNLVLLGSDLTGEEAAYLRQYAGRPFHAIRARLWDTTVWEWLFAINRTNFGWLDVDCFVLNPHLFDEMARVPDDVALNGCWTTYQGWAFLATYFLFVNQRIIDDMTACRPGLSPRLYQPWWDARGRDGRANLLTETERAWVRDTGTRKAGFDTTQLYQLACVSAGHRLRRVRELINDPQFGQFCSDELLHLTGASWYRDWFLGESSPLTHDHVMRAVMEYLLLDASDRRLPASYRALQDHLARMLGGDPRTLRRHLHRFLREKGLGDAAFAMPALDFLGHEPIGREARPAPVFEGDLYGTIRS